jgi:alkaline phosphatase D
MIDRRSLLQASMLGLGALSVPGLAAAVNTRGFTHGVASGEPTHTSVLLWTRYVAERDVKLRAEIALDAGFKRTVVGGETMAAVERDHTAKVVLDGLQPGRWYFYRFIAPNGMISRVGRTRTLPEGAVDRFGIALFSCSNLPFGYFNAYAHAASRDDLDLALHVGDYIYEYQRGVYPDAKSAVAERSIDPAHEILTLADYRLRYACYRLDPDLQALHARLPMIAQWDDHEIANDSWRNGAENHQPETEGSWETRKAVAMRVYREWMPVADDLWKEYQIGHLATLYKVETRIAGRSGPVDISAALRGATDVDRAIGKFRDDVWRDPTRTLMGAEQENWLHAALASSKRAGTRWQVLAQQVVMGDVLMPQAVSGWLRPDAPTSMRQYVQVGTASARQGVPFNFDSWGGFPAARERLLRAALACNSDLIVLSGDSHNAWGQNLTVDGADAGVEFAGHSVTSPGYEKFAPQISHGEFAAAMRNANTGLVYTELARRGYVSLAITPSRIDGSWHFMKTVTVRDAALADTQTLSVSSGGRKFSGV